MHRGYRGREWREAVTAACDAAARADLFDAAARDAARGDLEALDDVLWAVHRFELSRRPVRRLVLNESDADEVEQDVLVAVAESVHSFRGDARFTTWLHAIARRKAVDALRRRRMPTTPLPEDVGDAARISSLIAARTVLQSAIAALPARYRDPVVLRDVEGREYAEVARRLGLNLNTARTRIARGRALVAAQLRGQV